MVSLGFSELPLTTYLYCFRFSWFGNSQKVGIIGHQSKEKALCCLQQCPLLEDLAEWSHWDLVFRPELGDLREFVQKYGGVYSMPVTGKMKSIINTEIVQVVEIFLHERQGPVYTYGQVSNIRRTLVGN